MHPVLSVIIAQVLFTTADVMQKYVLAGRGFSAATLLNIRFLATLPIAGVGFVFLMYALSKMDISRTIILLSIFGVVFAAIAGVLIFHDKLALKNYIGILLAIAAIILVQSK